MVPPPLSPPTPTMLFALPPAEIYSVQYTVMRGNAYHANALVVRRVHERLSNSQQVESSCSQKQELMASYSGHKADIMVSLHTAIKNILNAGNS